ncbi:hypothetical protein [Mangrovicoccus ximenensis]|uniref:hypothetical protein n=1 Tax=Mangrovicoccus ximenensis TaxID=1911570 RepID=UPI000D3C4C82|nr:hypothetical protein [Mangrovicoccus ximenensis]
MLDQTAPATALPPRQRVDARAAALDAALPGAKRLAAFAGAAEAAAALPGLLRAGDVVMVKGSLGSKVSQAVSALRDAAKQGT